MTHESLFISLRLTLTSGLSVFTRISVPARTVLWLPVMWNSLPLWLRTTGGCGGPPAPNPNAGPAARGAAPARPAGAAAGAAPAAGAPGAPGPPSPRRPPGPPGPAPAGRGAAKLMRPTSPEHTEAFHVGWILQVSSVATLSF